MTGVFGPGYADCYDALYRAKDYEGEVDLIERFLNSECATGARRVLDMGCGTGNHAVLLARRGHVVHGVDRSADMLAHARRKAAVLAGQSVPVFHQSDIRDMDLGVRFDVVLMMFAVLCYCHDDRDVLGALDTAHRHLKPGGLFLFDVWNGAAVLADRPKHRRLAVEDSATRIVRETRPRLDLERRICQVRFDLQREDAAGRVETVTEEHKVRYFFALELEDLLRRSGFELIRLRGFPDDGAPPDEKAWNVVGFARRA
jgi:SAM-dependent methyltransferase